MLCLLLISHQNGDSLSFCYLHPFDTISQNHKELFLSRFSKLHSMGSHFACDLPSSIILLQRELFHWLLLFCKARKTVKIIISDLFNVSNQRANHNIPSENSIIVQSQTSPSVCVTESCKRCGSFGKVWE